MLLERRDRDAVLRRALRVPVERAVVFERERLVVLRPLRAEVLRTELRLARPRVVELPVRDAAREREVDARVRLSEVLRPERALVPRVELARAPVRLRALPGRAPLLRAVERGERPLVAPPEREEAAVLEREEPVLRPRVLLERAALRDEVRREPERLAPRREEEPSSSPWPEPPRLPPP